MLNECTRMRFVGLTVAQSENSGNKSIALGWLVSISKLTPIRMDFILK